ncbi:MAG: hypothetical protein II507_08420, partial [Treponema sp.]|nr:hypothetical protein [Treponema sp.]
MNIILAIIISAALSVVISVILGQINKSENSLERVRKYAEKRQGEFDEYFKKQRDTIRELESGLETKDIQAKAAVKRLDQQKEEFEQVTADLAKQINQVNDMNNGLEDYKKSFGELMEMGAAVEENLKRVKEEAGIITQLNQRLDSQKKKVDSLDRQIPALVEHFSSANSENLKLIGSHLLEEYESRARSIEDATKHAIEESHVIMNKIAADIKDTYDNAAERAGTLEDEAFKELQARADERTENCMNEIQQQTEQLQALVDSRIQALQQGINEQT